MQIVTGRRGEPHVTSRQMQAVYRSFLGDFALLDIGEKLRAEAYSNDIVRVYDGVISVQGIYAVIAYNQYDEVYIEPVSVGKKRIDTIVLHYTKDNALDVEDMQLDVVQGEEYTDNPVPPTISEGGDAWEGTTDIQVPIYDVEVTNFGLTVTPHTRMLTVIPTLDSIAERIPETVVTGVKGDSEVLYRDGDVNITKANIGLGNVDNTADTDKPISTATQTALNLKADLTYVDAKISAAYHAGGSKTVAELTSALLIADNIGKVFNMSDSGVTTSDFVEGAGKPINEGDNVGVCNVGTEESPVYKFDLLSGFVDLSAYATTSAVNTGLAGKVDKVTGKGLSTEDYTTTEKTKLAGISEGATQTVANPADTATETLSKLKVGGVVYDVPQGTTGATNLSELNDVNLSGTAEGDILEYDSTANKWKNSNALQGAKTATGNPLTIEDAAPVNAVNLSMDLEPVQDLHGYDHPWVGGAGKNKLPMTVDGIKAANTSGTWSGNVYTIYDRTFEILTDSDNNTTGIKVNGTFGSGVVQFYINKNIALPSGNYKLNGGISQQQKIFFYDGSSWYDSFGTDANFTITTQNTQIVAIAISNVTLTNAIFYPMIRLSTETDSSFAPYTNKASISGRSELPIGRVGGRNFIPMTVSEIKETNTQGTWNGNVYTRNDVVVTLLTNNDEEVTGIHVNGTPSTGFNFALCKNQEFPQGSYILNGTPSSSIDTFSTGVIRMTSPVASIGEDIGSGANINIESGILYYIRIGFNTNKAVNNKTFYPMLRLSTDTNANFEPYHFKTYTIQFGQTVYGGTLDATKGELTITDGYISSYDDESLPSTWISDRDVYVEGTTPTTGAEVCYELATPFTIDLTPTQIKMLENTNTLSSDGTITLEYQPNNAIGEAVRAVEESYDPEFAVRPVLKKKAFSGTTDSDGSVTLINASDIPSNHRIIPLHITDMTIGGSAGTYFVEYKPYNSGDSVKAYCYTYFNGSQITPVGSAVTGNFYYYELEV